MGNICYICKKTYNTMNEPQYKVCTMNDNVSLLQVHYLQQVQPSGKDFNG